MIEKHLITITIRIISSLNHYAVKKSRDSGSRRIAEIYACMKRPFS